MLPLKTILLGVTGGIAAYKAVSLLRLLLKQDIAVQVVMTASAKRFVGETTFQALSAKPVWSDLWDSRINNQMAHIELAKSSQLIVIAPASANILFKLAHGVADDLLSTLCSARGCPLWVAPAMNRSMWDNPANQRNIGLLKQDGVNFLGPDCGMQACGDVGEGRMLEPEALAALISAFFQPKLMQQQRVLVTAGATFEAIDPIRGLSNRSSGKMGFAIARAAAEAGAIVHLIAGVTDLATPNGVRRTDVVNAAQMLVAVNAEITNADIFISVAAVADYCLAKPATQKIKKDKTDHLSLTLVPTTDIIAHIAALPSAPFCVGFAAETEALVMQAEAKRKRKKLPLLVANLAQSTIGCDEAEVVLLDDFGQHQLPRAPKLEVARAIVAHIAGLYQRYLSVS